MAVIFFLPFILAFVLFILIAMGVMVTLARFGLLPGLRVKRRTFKQSRASGRHTETSFRFEEEVEGWYQSTQEGEIITLPETALRKESKDGPKDG
jgi:hypothetical protein